MEDEKEWEGMRKVMFPKAIILDDFGDWVGSGRDEKGWERNTRGQKRARKGMEGMGGGGKYRERRGRDGNRSGRNSKGWKELGRARE